MVSKVRVPFLDHPFVEFAATVPADIKFQNGHMKHLLRTAFAGSMPRGDHRAARQDGLSRAAQGVVRGAAQGLDCRYLQQPRAQNRDFINVPTMLANVDKTSRYSRKIWGLLSLELWQQRFHDRQQEFRNLLNQAPGPEASRPQRTAAAAPQT